MATKLNFVQASVPAPTTGSDEVNYFAQGGHTPASIDQNMANLREAADSALAALGGFAASQTPAANQIPVVKADLATVFPGNVTAPVFMATSATGNATVYIDGQSAAGKGGVITFKKGGVQTGAICHESAITGAGTLSHMVYFSELNMGHKWMVNGLVSTAMYLDDAGNLAPGADNAQTHGSAAKRWSVVYAGTGTINTSDARKKTAVAPLTEAELSAAKALASELGTFQFLDAVAEKGEDARHHAGMTVQRAIEVMQSHGLDPFRYGFICYDEWGDDFVEHGAEYDEDGSIVTPAWTEQVQWAGDIYSFRPTELLMFIARGFDARLAALEVA